MRDLFIDDWNKCQADTQYQGEGSSHELASLMVTEAVQHSKYTSNLPTFLLFLDAKSAFDTVVTPYLVRKLFMSGMEGKSLLYTDIRLSNRITYCQFQTTTAGPILDEQGVEQGGISSSDLYKIYNNELLTTAQHSKLGVDMGDSLVVSAVGQADDSVLISNDISKLQHILQLVLEYCRKFNVQLSSSKTKLIQIHPAKACKFVPYNPISIDNKSIEFVSEAEHVGVLRSESGNLPNILQRLSGFKKALGPLVACGLARGRRSNPAASMRILSIYATPVLLSGLPSLVLSPAEIGNIDQQYKRTLQNILKLAVSSPPALVHFVAGSLPLTAILHLRQLSLFGMICRLPANPLHSHAKHVLLTLSRSPNSWFQKVRDLLLQYQLPHPLVLLSDPPPKAMFKNLVKSKVTDYWETHLRLSVSPLLERSLCYFNPKYMSLNRPHKLLSAAGSNPYEVSKALIQLKFLSSQYPSNERKRHCTPTNRAGLCTNLSCSTDGIILDSQAYPKVREKLLTHYQELGNIFSRAFVNKTFMKFNLWGNSLKSEFFYMDSLGVTFIDASPDAEIYRYVN